MSLLQGDATPWELAWEGLFQVSLPAAPLPPQTGPCARCAGHPCSGVRAGPGHALQGTASCSRGSLAALEEPAAPALLLPMAQLELHSGGGRRREVQSRWASVLPRALACLEMLSSAGMEPLLQES